ncbi:hypothetical protein E8E14_010095 [Neopestalotiopsis sp. 37M]|nr:hypothetical protein E8E14_010095 [Neopestalotiopsis sp. 37M]
MTRPIDIPAKRREPPAHEPVFSPDTREMNAVRDHIDNYGWSSHLKKLYGHRTDLRDYQARSPAEVIHGQTAFGLLTEAWAAYPVQPRPACMRRQPPGGAGQEQPAQRQQSPVREPCRGRRQRNNARGGTSSPSPNRDGRRSRWARRPAEDDQGEEVDKTKDERGKKKVRFDLPESAPPSSSHTSRQALEVNAQEPAARQAPEVEEVVQDQTGSEECAVGSDSEDDDNEPPSSPAPSCEQKLREAADRRRLTRRELHRAHERQYQLRQQERSAWRAKEDLEMLLANARKSTRIPVYLSPRHDDLSN